MGRFSYAFFTPGAGVVVVEEDKSRNNCSDLGLEPFSFISQPPNTLTH